MITSGTRLGPYEVLAPLGAGGMGEVWRGRDTRLERNVAIKVLPAEFAENAQLKLRFEREAKTISQLNHPHICTLYDVGDNYLVMELLEGETLAERLTRGPLPLPAVLRYGMQIADALDKAHRQGVIHRDLKPANIMITKSGAKLLDFGLAKPAMRVAPISAMTNLATEQKALTQEGTIVGTFQYMAPEQLVGDEADARSDLFALGAVLYEMTTGQRAFQGKTKTSLVTAIVSGEPTAVSQIQPLTPPALEHLIKKCLAKDPDDRWQSAHDVAEELRWITEAGSHAGVAAPILMRRKTREMLAWSVAAVLAVIAAASTIGYVRRAPRPQRPVRLTLVPPPNAALVPFDLLGIALSPDGSMLAFSAIGSDGKRALWIRRFDAPAAQLIADTSDASYPFWSPDGSSVGFFAEGKLKKVNLAGGSPQIICDAPSGRGGSWGRDGTILLAPNLLSGIYKVPAKGGTPVMVIPDDKTGSTTYRWPLLLPDGKHFLYLKRERTTQAPVGQLYVASIDGGQPKLIAGEASNAVYLQGGYIVYGRGEDLVAQKFNLAKLETEGEPFAILSEKVSHYEPKNLTTFTVSDDGSIVYLPTRSIPRQLAWFGRDGVSAGSLGSSGYISFARLSPDNRRIALVRGEPQRGIGDIWIYDVQQNHEYRFTYAAGQFGFPRWSPDGNQLLFTYQRKQLMDIFVKRLSGGDMQLALESRFYKTSMSWLPAGDSFVFAEQNPTTNNDLYLYSLRNGKRTLLLATPFDEGNAAVSPDGQWLAYSSNETGKSEIYVRSLRDASTQFQLSTSGGSQPFWRADGRELFWADPQGTVISVQVKSGASFQPDTPRRLFQMPTGAALFDVGRDGSRFLVAAPTERVPAPAFEVVLNATSLLEKRKPQ